MAVPIQALQVEHRLSHPAVARLLHPQYAVHAFYGAAGPDRVIDDRYNPVISGLLGLVEGSLRTQVISHRGEWTRRRLPGGILSSPPSPSPDRTPFRPWLGPLETLVHAIQEGKTAWAGEEVADFLPSQSGQLAQAGLDFGLRPLPINEAPRPEAEVSGRPPEGAVYVR